MYLLQVWFSLSDEGVEDAICDSYAMRKFTGINFMDGKAPDATTLLHFRRQTVWAGRCLRRSGARLKVQAR